jgi:hypothetical protein
LLYRYSTGYRQRLTMSTIHKVALFRSVLGVVIAVNSKQAAMEKQSRSCMQGEPIRECC